MREMKDSGIEWIKSIPSNWSVMPNKYLMRKIKEICPTYGGQDILSLTMKGVIVRDLDAGGKMPSSFDGYQFLYTGNLLMCLFDIDVTPRCIGFIKQNGITSPAYSQFVLTQNADAAYYCYYYTMLDNDKTLLHLAKNLRHSLTEDQLGAISVIVPPLSEQRHIAAFLDAKCAEIDALAADIQAEIDTLEQYKRSIITEAVTKGLNPDAEMKASGIEWIGDIPTGWSISRTKYLYSTHKTIAGIKSVDYDRLALTMNGVIKRSKTDNTGLQPDNFDTYQILRIGELVFKLIDLQNVSTSRVGLSPYTGLVSPAYIILAPNEGVVPEFGQYYFLSLWHREIFNHLGDDGVRSSLNAHDLLEIPYPILSYIEQRQIAAFLDVKCGETDSIIADKRKQLETLDAYKKSIIFEYVTGKKEVPVA